MMSHRILPAALLLCTLAAACGDLPTDTAAQPAGPAYNGGYTIGSGGAAAAGGYTVEAETQDTGGFGIGSGKTEDASPETTSGSESDAERGGYTIGSGG